MNLRLAICMNPSMVITYRFFDKSIALNNTELRDVYLSGNMKIKMPFEGSKYSELCNESNIKGVLISKMFRHKIDYPIMPIEFER